MNEFNDPAMDHATDVALEVSRQTWFSRLMKRSGTGALAIMLFTMLTGCVGYVEGGYGTAVVVPPPHVSFYGGYYERGPDVHIYSHRGYDSRHWRRW